jgi:murein DD-endopeptidase MepM/ murein hydrolase activator NlpD
MFRRISSALLFLYFFGLSIAPAIGQTEGSWSLHWQPSHLINGSPIIFQVTPPTHLKSLTSKWLDHEVYFAFDPHNKKWFGFAGVSLETKSGKYPMQLSGVTSKGTKISFARQLAITRGEYTSIAVTVGKEFTQPDPEQLRKAVEDKTLKQDVFSRVNPLREWSGKFDPPVIARTSDVFGTQRTFNGEVQSTHQGLDFAVPTGTPVAAVNSGTILVARPLFFEGNCVMLDHGQGLLSIYMHLSEFNVKEGEHVVRGQIIGLSGGTGRASGPHLHLAIRWEGLYLDPAILLKLKMP